MPQVGQQRLAPLTEHFCAESQLAYLAAGTAGEPIVLLHGWGAFREVWWSTLLQLGIEYQVFAPDMPGHRGSALLESRTMAQIATRIGVFCAARGFEQITLVGHSMGGNVALELALAQPHLVRRLVLVDAAAQGHELPLYTRSYLIDTVGFAALRLTILLSKKTRWLGEAVPHDHGGGTILPALRRMAYTADHDATVMHQLLGTLIANSIEKRAAEIQVPTLVVSGQLDPLVPEALSRRLAAAIPGAHYTVIRNAAHNPMDENPQDFVAALRTFFAVS